MASDYAEFNSESLSDESEEETWSSNSQTSSEGNLSWIAWWCAHQGHEYFAEVSEDFIEDDFNMTGLSACVPLYKEALELILDLEPEDDYEHTAAQQDAIEGSAEELYGLIHQRYICSRNGLVAMAEKYEAGYFGVCPRIACNKTAVLPIGQSDVVKQNTVKLYCPTCLDIYQPPNSRFNLVDGAYFGTTFPHLFFMTFPELLPTLPDGSPDLYIPRIYGFKVSTLAKSGPKMGWLRRYLPQAGNNETDQDGEALSPKISGLEASTKRHDNGRATAAGEQPPALPGPIPGQTSKNVPEPAVGLVKGEQEMKSPRTVVAVRKTKAAS